jgi:TolB-like protein/DNA-binding winged helix-turn-helix (wHTH) protein/Flp pilus assembly protein TadD
MSGTIEPPTRIPFGPFEADLPSQELRKQGVRLRLPRQSFQILKMLLERPGEVVTREELRAKLWPADTFVDFDHGLNAAVKRLRDALDDSAENPRFIETLPRLGYRFIAGAVREALPLEKKHTPPKQWSWLIGAAAVLLIAGALFAVDVGGVRSRFLSRSPAQPQVRSLAVLPLANLSGDPQQQYFADAMTDELIAELSRISSLKVISHTSVMQYQGEKKKPIPQIGQELRVDAIMEGTVLRSGNRVRIAAQLIYAPTDQHLMAETYESDLGDVLKLQREVAEAVAEKVRARLTAEQQAHFHETPKVDAEAYEAYLIALSANLTVGQEASRARSYLQKAIQKDPNFSLAYSALASTYVFDGEMRRESPQEVYPLAKQAANKALQLDEKSCWAHRALGRIIWRYDWDWKTAESEFHRMLELCPNASGAHWDMGFYFASNGRIAEAEAEAVKVRELDPIRSEPLASEAIVNYHLRNYKVLTEVSRRFTTTYPNDWLPHYWQGVGLEGSGQTREATTEYQRAVELSQGDSDPTASLAYAYAATGNTTEAEKILHQFLRQSETSFVSPYMIATVYAALGNKNKAFEYLEEAYQIRSTDLPYFLRADLRLDTLRSDPRFQDLMRRMNFPQ